MFPCLFLFVYVIHKTTKMRTQSHPQRVAHCASTGHHIQYCLCSYSLDNACPGRALLSISLHMFHLRVRTDLILLPSCYAYNSFLCELFCLAISALAELTMWPAMYYLEKKQKKRKKKKAVIFFFEKILVGLVCKKKYMLDILNRHMLAICKVLCKACDILGYKSKWMSVNINDINNIK